MTFSLRCFCIYDNPADIPGKVVVREWVVVEDKLLPMREPHAVVSTVVEARASLPKGLIRVPREKVSDDPVIKEVWI